MNIRHLVLRAVLVSLAATLPSAVQVSAEVATDDSPDNPAYVAMLGSGAPSGRAKRLGDMLHLPGTTLAERAPFFSLLRDTGSPGSPKFELSGATLELEPDTYSTIRVENARIVLMPSPDGRTCRFELSGSPFGTGSKFEATGTIEWKAGPSGGDKLDVEVRLDGAPVEAIRAWSPTRMDPSFSGVVSLQAKAGGVVGELTTEEAPATPLKGDFQATLDWTAFGRTAPMTIRSPFSLDDRMIRFVGGRLSWLTESLDLKGWAKPAKDGDFELLASFKDVDTAAVAARWNVPPAWRPASTLTGVITMKGKPGKSLMRHEAKAALITLPAIGGYDVRIEDPQLSGSLAAINAEVAVSIRSSRIVVGGIDLGPLPVGVRWWKNEVMVNNSNSELFGGENEGSLKYVPADHPEFMFNGRVKNAEAPRLVKGLVPWLDFDVEGVASIAFATGLKKDYTPRIQFHGSLTQGRIGGVDLFRATLAELAKVDPALTLAPETVPAPRKGTGMRVDRWFFEGNRVGDKYEIGGLFMINGGFRLDADGQFTRAGGLELEGTVSLPTESVASLAGAAPWTASLGRGGSMFVPVKVSGKLSSLSVAIAPGYAELVAKAKRGETIEAPGTRVVNHVGEEIIATIPVDPALLETPQ
jgi:hypothetical protein